MKATDEKLAEFNSRMNDWITKQGLLFQLTHGGTGLGGRPPLLSSLIRAAFSLVLLTLLAALGFAGFLFWKATGDQLPKEFKSSIANNLAVEEVMASGFKRDFGSGRYKEIIAEGSDASFFNRLDARSISFRMEPLDGIFGNWEAGNLKVRELDLVLKAGEADSDRASRSWQSLFAKSPSFSFNGVEVEEATLSWGYSSPATWGSIIGSRLTANRTPTGWGLRFQGGMFSQGIFRHLTIQEILVAVDQDGSLEITRAELTKNGGSLSWSGKMVSGGAKPSFAIEGTFTQLPVSTFLPPGVLDIVNGQISGKLSASGSTNDSNGICYQIEATPAGTEGLYLTKELSLLRILSHLDSQRSYRKAPFSEGSFKLETQGSTLSFSEIDLASQTDSSSKALARLRGSFTARPSTPEDFERGSGELSPESGTEQAEATTSVADANQVTREFADEMSNRFPELQFSNPHLELRSLAKDRANDRVENNRVELTPRRQARIPFWLKGEVQLAIPGTAFKNTVPLPQVAEEESKEGLRWITLSLDGLATRSTQDLSDQWERTMGESGRSGL